MAEALVAVGLASNVLQFIDFGTKLCARIQDYSSTINGSPKKLKELGDHLSNVLKTLESLDGTKRTYLEHEESTIQSCLRQAQELNAYLDSFQLQSNSFRSLSFEKLRLAFKSVRGEKQVEEFQRVLDQLLNLVNLQLQIKNASLLDDVHSRLDLVTLSKDESTCYLILYT